MVRLERARKRKAIPNPNRVFITISEALAAGKAIPERNAILIIVTEEIRLSKVEALNREVVKDVIQVTLSLPLPVRQRSGRIAKKPRNQ